jgi:predicted TIM-barrel fold metal-dependent hydrolase
LVIDVHGHISTPPHFRAYAYNLIALRTVGGKLAISDEQMAAPLARHLRLLDSHRIDVQLLSPRPVAMMHWEQPHLVDHWTRTTNDLIARQCKLHPDRFVGIAQLNQTPYTEPEACVPELERAIGELGFAGALLNPDPGGDRESPGLNDEAWFPLYKKAEELKATLVVHPSISHDPRLAIISHSYQYNNVTEETLATLLLEQSDVFDTFPNLRIVICHCGGSLKRITGRGEPADAVLQGHGQETRLGSSGETAGGSGNAADEEAHTTRDVSQNLFFDTCAYDMHFLGAAIKQRGVARMVFGTEVPGSGSDIFNPLTNAAVDDLVTTLESYDFLTDDDRKAIVHDNPLRVFPLLAGKLPKAK